MAFKDLLGKNVPFFGTDGNAFKLGDEVFEMDADGEVATSAGHFLSAPCATVKPQKTADGYELVDGKGFVWFSFGVVDGEVRSTYASPPDFVL